ncbi:MAG TPA: AMP-binding protein [Phycisphaerae bacterium]|nr:AMP-binding protein [Phycisphaerae bacterium]HRY68079.1 AMP-binding protein [Phycisphaerae bacterium]HSA29047.1 AMP-binding protein [Phycisphaerae bacterium]
MPELIEKLDFQRIHFANRVYTPREVQSTVDDLAAHLRAKRISDSPFAFVFAYNHIKTVIACFAVQKAGMILVPVDPDIRPLELADLLTDSEPSVLIRYDPKTLEFDYRRDLEFRRPASEPWRGEDLSRICMMVYTAAEDGWYKGALLTREGLLSVAHAIVRGDHVNPRTVSCMLAPLHHLYGFQAGLLVPLLGQGTVVLQEIKELSRLRSSVTDMAEYGVTNLYSVPMVFYLISRVPMVRNWLGTVVGAVSGGYKLMEPVFRTFRDKTGLEIHEGYGLTEASPVCTWHIPEDRVRIHSVGRAFGDCEVCIRDRKGNRMPPGRSGEVCARGVNVMQGYFRHPEATSRAIRDGWLYTGDLGYMDEDGYVYLTGLAKRMLNVGGKNVYPREVERLALLHGNVQNATVFGKESTLGGHEVDAKFVLRDGANGSREAFSRWFQENLSRYKLPRRIEFV